MAKEEAEKVEEEAEIKVEEAKITDAAKLTVVPT